MRFFGARSPLQNTLYWRQRLLQKNFEVGQTKMDVVIYTKGGLFGKNWQPELREGGGRWSPIPLPPHPRHATDYYNYFVLFSQKGV